MSWKSEADLSVLDAQEISRQDVLHELFESEARFGADMTLLLDLFLDPLQLQQHWASTVEFFWHHAQQIQACSACLHMAMRGGLVDGIVHDPGRPFVQHLRELESYNEFCVRQGIHLRAWTRHRNTDRKLDAFIRQQEADPRCERMDAESFLLKPMQRITKYPLLLGKALHLTRAENPDLPMLSAAHRAIVAQVESINEQIRQVHLSTLFSDLCLHLEVPKPDEMRITILNQQLHHEGNLHAVTRLGHRGSELHAFLVNNAIWLTKKKQSSDLKTHKWTLRRLIMLHDILPIQRARPIPASGSQPVLKLATVASRLSFYVKSEADRLEWLDRIESQLNWLHRTNEIKRAPLPPVPTTALDRDDSAERDQSELSSSNSSSSVLPIATAVEKRPLPTNRMSRSYSDMDIKMHLARSHKHVANEEDGKNGQHPLHGSTDMSAGRRSSFLTVSSSSSSPVSPSADSIFKTPTLGRYQEEQILAPLELPSSHHNRVEQGVQTGPDARILLLEAEVAVLRKRLDPLLPGTEDRPDNESKVNDSKEQKGNVVWSPTRIRKRQNNV